MQFRVGEHVEKYKGDYTGPGIVEIAKILSDGRERYLVAHKIEGRTGTFLHVYSPAVLRSLEKN